MTPKPDSRLPWRVVFPKENFGLCQVWTNQDDTLGNRNNYMIADSIQSEAEAQLIAQAPTLQSRVHSLTTAKDAALAILERLRASVYTDQNPLETQGGIAEAIEVLKRS